MPSGSSTNSLSPVAEVDFCEIEWRKRLSEESYIVCRLSGTEIEGSGKYLNHDEVGTYVCIGCRTPLFRSEDKFRHCGWPSFRQAIGTRKDGSEQDTDIARRYDKGRSMEEILCRRCHCHLGHVFGDGPPPFNRRFCVNSVSLDFVKDPRSEDGVGDTPAPTTGYQCRQTS